MIQIKYTKKDGSVINVTPMPSCHGHFSDPTNPNCNATNCCLIRASQVIQEVSTPQLTKEEKESAILSQMSILEDVEVTDKEVQDRIDTIRGYTQEDFDKWIEDNKKYKTSIQGELVLDVNGNKILTSIPTDEEAHLALVKKERSVTLFLEVPVLVPSEAEVRTLIIDENKRFIAEVNVNQMIASGHLVTDLDALDENGNEIYASWKSQFEVIEIASI